VIPFMTFAAVLGILVALPLGQTGDVTIPVTNRPGNFSGAAGDYRIDVRATPTTVQVEDPITLTVKIISLVPGPWPHPPQRDKLRLLPAELEKDFFIEPLPERDRFIGSEKAWEFSWRLMPKREGTSTIPAMEFVYYHTTGTPDFKAADGATTIALDVKPRPALLLTAPAGSQAKLQQIVLGEVLLTQRSPTLALVAVGLSLPPILCFAAYFLWWRLFPDAAERLRRRQGRALKTALWRMRKLGSAPTPAQVRGVLADYLRLRLAMPPGEPTPLEVRQALLARGLAIDQVQQTEATLQRYDAALFAPASPPPRPDFKEEATQLLRGLEVTLCSRPSQ
jgi:BatD DUF11 like domain